MLVPIIEHLIVLANVLVVLPVLFHLNIWVVLRIGSPTNCSILIMHRLFRMCFHTFLIVDIKLLHLLCVFHVYICCFIIKELAVNSIALSYPYNSFRNLAWMLNLNIRFRKVIGFEGSWCNLLDHSTHLQVFICDTSLWNRIVIILER